MPDCQCGLTDKVLILGLAAALCPHSPQERVRQTQQDIQDTLAQFAQAIEPEDIFSALAPLAQEYGRSIAQDDYQLLTRNEHNTLMVSFLRQISLAAQAMMTTMLLNRDPGDD